MIAPRAARHVGLASLLLAFACSDTNTIVAPDASSSDAAVPRDAATIDAPTPSDASSATDAAPTTDATPPGDAARAIVYCGHPADCATGDICGMAGVCQPGPCDASNACVFGYACVGGACTGPADACDRDADCASGSLCIAGRSGGGVCTPVDQQCFDQSQCDAGEVCDAGKCTLVCRSNADCRDGFGCDTTRGVCTVVLQSCTLTNDCGSASLVCVAGACVPRSLAGACHDAGDVWTENGCIPNQAPTFTCTTDGQLGSGTGVTGVSCAAGSICLHHDCWISCDVAMQNACANQAILNQCKPVADNSMTYDVCGSAQNLGSQCGPGAGGQTCSNSAICIDGFCK